MGVWVKVGVGSGGGWVGPVGLVVWVGVSVGLWGEGEAEVVGK